MKIRTLPLATILTKVNRIVDGTDSLRKAARELRALHVTQEDLTEAKDTLCDENRQAALTLLAAQKDPRTRAKIIESVEPMHEPGTIECLVVRDN